MIITRRGLIGGLVGLVAAPALVRAESLMQIRGVPLGIDDSFSGQLSAEDIRRAMIELKRIAVGGPYYLVVPPNMVPLAKTSYPGVKIISKQR